MASQLIFIVSGPGGVGKGTLVRELVKSDPTLWLSKSWTTRPRRAGEASNAYNFVSEDEFQTHAGGGGFLEWVEFLGHHYGTPMPDPPQDKKDVILEIELQGAQKVRRVEPSAILVLIVPPSLEEQRMRLRQRGDDEMRIDKRLEVGQREMATGRELADEIVVNDDLATAVETLSGIVARYRAGDAHRS